MMRAAFAIVALCLVTPSLHAAEKPEPSAETKRLVDVCNLWGTIKFVHPYIWSRDVDWDAALTSALPKIRAAANEDQYAAAIDIMLRGLGDPATRVVTRQGPPSRAQKTTPAIEWPKPGVLLLRLTGGTPPPTTTVIDAVKKAKSIVIDLRVADGWARWEAEEILAKIVSAVAYRELRSPAKRLVINDGYRPQSKATSGNYFSALEQRAGATIAATPGAKRTRVAFLLGEVSGVPDAALALQSYGDAVIVLQGARFDDVTSTIDWPIGGTHVARMRLSELEPSGPVAPHADAELPADASDDAMLAAALSKLSAPAPKRNPAVSLPPVRWPPEKTYPETKALSVEMRLLALFRLWNVIDNFYPYKLLLDEKWSDVLEAFIPRVIAAEGAKPYVETMAELTAHIADSHTYLDGGDAELGTGRARAGLLARVIERQPTVAAVDETAAKAGVHVGDVILAVDGEPVAKRMARLRRFVAGSNDVEREYGTLVRSLGGADGSTIRLTVRDLKGAQREVELVRKRSESRTLYWRSGEVVKILDGNVGYVDLDRLQREQVPAMFEKLGGTRAIIFDMRGYPNGTAWSIVPQLNVKNAEFGAAFEHPIVAFDPEGSPSRKWLQVLSPGSKPYRGKTFMLVDERTASQAEHTGLFFEAAAGTKFIGSQTAGTNGDVTDVTLPGGLDLFFTGNAVRHADGRQLQRVGLPIDVKVTPTQAAIRAGRDEVLERALDLARK